MTMLGSPIALLIVHATILGTESLGLGKFIPCGFGHWRARCGLLDLLGYRHFVAGVWVKGSGIFELGV